MRLRVAVALLAQHGQTADEDRDAELETVIEVDRLDEGGGHFVHDLAAHQPAQPVHRVLHGFALQTAFAQRLADDGRDALERVEQSADGRTDRDGDAVAACPDADGAPAGVRVGIGDGEDRKRRRNFQRRAHAGDGAAEDRTSVPPATAQMTEPAAISATPSTNIRARP